jgi:hypothetical protein
MEAKAMRIVIWILISLGTAAARVSATDPATAGLARGRERPTAEVSLLHATSSMNLETGDVQRTFIVQADLVIPAEADAVGMSHQIELTELKGSDGQDLLAAWRRTGQIVFGGPRHYSPLTGPRQPGRGAVSLSTSINGLPYLPSGFEVVRGRAHLLLATRRVVRELSPLTEGAMLELTPSLVVQIVRMKHEGNSLEIRYEYRADQPAPFFNPNVRPPFIDQVSLIDDSGSQLTGHSGAPQPGEGRQGVYEGQGQLMFNIPDGRAPRAVQFSVVIEMQEQDVEFLARDARLPIEP